METTRIQTGLRFRPALIEKLKIKAKRSNKSFNKYVEDLLEKDVADEFPHLNREDFIKNNEFLALGKTIGEIPQEVIDADPKLAHILGV
jgi:hypothetical protein